MNSVPAFLRPRTICALAFGVFSAAIAPAEVLLGPGDKLSIAVVGTTDFDATITIDGDGQLHLPVIGSVAAAGRTLDALESSVAQALSAEPIQSIPNDGQAIWRRIDPKNVYLSVAEFRPIYVAGDVRQSGAQPFRPGMTVRQALVLAGGLGPAQDAARADTLVRLQAERAVLQSRLHQSRATVARLQTEIAAMTDESARPTEQLPQRSREWLEARADLRALNDSATELSLQQMYGRLLVLEQLEQVSREALDTYETEFDRVRKLADRGVVTANSVTEAQRGVLSFSSRALEATSEAYNVRNDIARLNERAKATRRADHIDGLNALMAEQARTAELEARLAAIDAQMPLAGGAGAEAVTTTLAIFRRNTDGEARIEAAFDSLLAPGDVLSVQLTPAQGG